MVEAPTLRGAVLRPQRGGVGEHEALRALLAACRRRPPRGALKAAPVKVAAC